MRRSLVLAGFATALATAGVALAGGLGSAASEEGAAPRWQVRDLGTPPGQESEAIALNAAGQVVGAYAARGAVSSGCTNGFLWQNGVSKTIPPELCLRGGDMCVSQRAATITPGGRVLGTTDRLCWNGGFLSYWLWPPLPDPSNSWRPGPRWPRWQDPAPRKGQSSRTCWLAKGGRTACRAFRGLPAATGPVVEEQGCAGQNWPGAGVNDRGEVAGYLEACIDAGTGETYAPASYFLAGRDGWVTFGPGGQGTIDALDARGRVVGAIPTSSGGWHAFLWDGARIVDLGTLGGRHSRATVLNDRLEVAGTSRTRSGGKHGFLWRNGRMIDLGPISPLAVNARGDVLGTRTEGKRLHGFLWRNGRLVGLGYWRTDFEWYDVGRHALSLDDRGRVVGADEAGHAAVWEAGVRRRLPELPGGSASAAVAANAAAGIAGWSTDAKGVRRAVLWTEGSGA